MVSFMDPETLREWVGVSDCMSLGPGEWKGQSFEEGGRVSFILFCVTSIKTQKYSTRTTRHKSAALYLQLRLAPAHLASRLQVGVGEGSAT